MEEVTNNLLLEYNVPIQSKAFLDGDFVIEGIAINETTTSNGHVFLGEELDKSASTLIGVPLLKDHNNSVDSIVGRVKAAHFSQDTRNIPFRAIVKDKAMQEKIKSGLVNSVSVGAHVNPMDIEEDDDGNIIPHNITFKELSLVAVPADSGATFSVALNNAYSSIKDKNLKTVERGLMTMTEEEQNQEVQEEPTEEPTEEPKEEPKEETEEPQEEPEEPVEESEVTALKEEIEALKAKIAESEEKPKEVEDEEPEVEEPDVEEKAYVFSQKGTSFSLERKSYVYN